MRCAKWLTRPVAETEDFRVEFRFPPSLMVRSLELVATRMFGVDDWNETLVRLTTDSGYTHEHLANIPPNTFSIPSLFILAGVVKRCLAGMVFPQKLIASASGPTAWTLLAGVTSGTVVGVGLGFLCSSALAVALVALAATTCMLLLWSGKAQSTARALAAGGYAVETTSDAHTDGQADEAASTQLSQTLSRANALAPTLISTRASRAKATSGVNGARDEFGVCLANGESVEVIKVRFLHFTRFAPLDVGEKYIGPGAFAPWTADEETLIKKTVQQNDIGGGNTFDWRVVEEEFERREVLSSYSGQETQNVKPAGGARDRIGLRRSSGDLRRHYEEMKDRELMMKGSSNQEMVQSEYRRVLPGILNCPQHRNKAGIVLNPELLTVQQRETAKKVELAEWKARADAFVTAASEWRRDKQLQARRQDGGTGAKYLKKIWERDVEGALRDSLAHEMWVTYLAEREAHLPESALSLGRTLTRNSPAGGVSWGEFLSFHLQMPSQLQQDHVNEIIKLQPVEQRALIHKLLAVAVRNFREAEEVQAAAIDRNQPGRDNDTIACAARSLPAGHDRRIVNKIINNFDRLCTQALAPGGTYRISTEDDEEDWLLVKPKVGNHAKPFYYEKNSNRRQWEKPLTGKTRCESPNRSIACARNCCWWWCRHRCFPSMTLDIEIYNVRVQITSSLNCCENTSLGMTALVSVPVAQKSEGRLRTPQRHLWVATRCWGLHRPRTSRACSCTAS